MGFFLETFERKILVLILVFDKMMMFNLDTLSPKQFQTGVIKIEAFDYNAFSDDILIGAFEFGTGNVNMQPGHEYHNVWIGLINPVMGFDMQGYLKVRKTPT